MPRSYHNNHSETHPVLASSQLAEAGPCEQASTITVLEPVVNLILDVERTIEEAQRVRWEWVA